MKIVFKDGKCVEYDKGLSAFDIGSLISPSLVKKTVFVVVNDEYYDLNAPLTFDAKLEFVLEDDVRCFEIINHSCSHLMAKAIKNLYPNVMFGVGPAIEEGFYYDFQITEKINEDSLKLIENEMNKIIVSGIGFKKETKTKEEALKIFENDIYKTELINDLNVDYYNIYSLGNFIDLCRGPHVSNIKFLRNFKLLNISGAYWRGDSKNIQLQRIYGTCFSSKEALEDHLLILKERESRDHRKIGKELELFMLSEYGPGFPFWLPNGMILRKKLEDYWYKIHIADGYSLIQTPIMLNKELWEVSGHWFNYKENMYTSEIDKHEFAIKPMNCPGGLIVYKNNLHSYKDFPLKIAELGIVHRHEASGALSGLFRVRNFTQDDAHIYILESQIVDEVGKLVKMFDKVYSDFGLKYNIELSTRPLDKYIGTIEIWDKAQEALKKSLEKINIPYKINEGDGAFYGPKLDFKLKDSMNRIWQCGTIQLDMNLPIRFDITYINELGEKSRPVMLHRAIFGSLERFIGILIEHYKGAFPFWLAPIQLVIIPVNNEFHLDYSLKIYKKCLDYGFNVLLDKRDEKLSYKIRDAQIKKIPYQIVIGDKEILNKNITYRKYSEKDTTTCDNKTFFNMLMSFTKNLK